MEGPREYSQEFYVIIDSAVNVRNRNNVSSSLAARLCMDDLDNLMASVSQHQPIIAK